MHKNNLNAGITTWNNIFLKKRVPRLSIGVCRWCENVFIKKHNKESYCSDNCRYYSLQEHSRRTSHKWYHRHKNELSEKQRWGLGTGTLGPHMNSDVDFEREASIIAKEFNYLRIKRRK